MCKGVKLNFSKTGMSVSLGTKGYHKTISTSGRVTTTVRLPGTGIYYTDTKKIGGQNRSSTQQATRRNGSNSATGLFGRKRNEQSNNLQRYDDLAAMNSIYDEPEYVEIPDVQRSVDLRDKPSTANNGAHLQNLSMLILMIFHGSMPMII